MATDEQWIGKRYQLLDLIGVGGMGRVYRAHDRLTDTIVALKQVMVSNEQLITNSMPDPMQQSDLTLAKEFRTLATLRHPHIISVLDYGFDDAHYPYFTMELLNNARPITVVSQDVGMDVKLTLIVQVLQALSYLHRRGILHRDLKPDNVLVTDADDGTYRVHLLDFGLAITFDVEDRSTNVVGTLAYLAPEIIQEQPATQASDLYAVGMMMYEMLAGEYPFRFDYVTELMESILYFHPRIPVPGIDREIGSVLRKLLNKSPEKRYQDAESVLNAIAGVVDIPIQTETTAVRESFLQSARFVGREDEFNQLTTALSYTRGSRGSLWLVRGESGVGKSRLLDELRTVGLVEGALVLRGQAISGGSTQYQVWRDVIRRLLLSVDLSAEQISVLKDIIPDIDHMLNRTSEDVHQLSEVAQKERLTDTLIQVISQQSQPTLILLEDLHWAVDSIDLLVQLSSKLAELPICIVGTYRTDEGCKLHEKLPDANVISLKRLTRQEMEMLSVSMVGHAAQEPGVLDLVERETEGNTFFIVEVMRALAEDAGSLDHIGRVTLPESVLTGGINSVIERRMSRISRSYYDFLTLAAVAGRQLDLQLLQYTLDRYDTFGDFLLDDWLSECESAAIINILDEQWQFSHDKLREYLLQHLTDMATYHRYVAEAIEAVYPDDKARYTSLAEHWLKAKNDEKALQYGIPAAKQMKDVSNYRGAINLLNAIYDKWEPDHIDQSLQCDFYYRLGELNERLSENETAKTYFDRSYTLAKKIDDHKRLAIALQGRGLVAYNTGDYEQAVANLQMALQYAELLSAELQANIYKILSNVYSQQDEIERSNDYIRKALDISLANDIQIEVAGSLNNLGVNQYLVGDYQGARKYYQQALTVYTDIGYRSGIALCYSNIGDVAFDEGVEKQIEYYEKGLAIYRDIGNQWGIALCLENMSSAYYVLNEYDRAVRLLEQALTISRRIGNRYAEQHELMELGFAYNALQNFEKASQYLQESLQLARELDLASHLALCLAYSAYNDIDLKQFDEAMTKLNEVMDILGDNESRVYLLEVLATYARLLCEKESYEISFLLCEFILNQPTLEDITRQIIVNPVHKKLRSVLVEDQQQLIRERAEQLNLDQALKVMQTNV